jgi:pimeloyl-ACP methyl ester carboxylesterase
VPLDWQDENNQNTLALDIAKLPAKVPNNDPSFGGTIFVNPGGPGGSGTYFILNNGHLLQDYADGNKSYVMLGWDPRGIGFTTPQADCFGNITARDLSDLQEAYIGPLDASQDVLRRQWAHNQAYGHLCEQGAVNGSILPYITTASVVCDMIGMLDSMDELQNEAQHLPTSNDSYSDLGLQISSSGPLRILYWGFSYGSLLGNAFAFIYPGRVGRLFIDGIVDANDYMKGVRDFDNGYVQMIKANMGIRLG